MTILYTIKRTSLHSHVLSPSLHTYDIVKTRLRSLSRTPITKLKYGNILCFFKKIKILKSERYFKHFEIFAI